MANLGRYPEASAGQKCLQGKLAPQLALRADWKDCRQQAKGKGSAQYFGARKASNGKPVESVNEEPSIHSLATKL